MKTTISLLFVLLFVIASVGAQTASKEPVSCCEISPSATKEFAMLASKSSFRKSHVNPKPFTYDSKNGKMVSFKTADGVDAKAFEIKAAKPTNNYVFVIQEWWGLNDYIKQEAEKIQTELGNVNVLALDMYDGKVATTRDSAGKYMKEAKEERLRAIVNGAIAYAGKDAKIATVGWCFGGGWSLQSSLLAGKQAVACVMYYGMPEKDAAKLKDLNAPVLGLFAKKDGWITPAVAAEFEKTMKTLSKPITVKIYDADHAFANPSNPKYDKTASDDAHQLTIAFFKKQLGL
jgi:carboxymethylenebutenolidase